jgi:hypothetical protein
VIAPQLPQIRKTTPVMPLPIDYMLVGGHKSSYLQCPFESVVTTAQTKTLAANETSIWFHGYIAYDDAFDWGRQLDFVWLLDFKTRTFRIHHFREIESQKPHERKRT